MEVATDLGARDRLDRRRSSRTVTVATVAVVSGLAAAIANGSETAVLHAAAAP